MFLFPGTSKFQAESAFVSVSLFKTWSDPDPVFSRGSDPDPVFSRRTDPVFSRSWDPGKVQPDPQPCMAKETLSERKSRLR